MRGYFGLGVEGITKPRNAGSLFRSAHAFGASFVFAIAPYVNVREVYQSDTSETGRHVPLYEFGSVAEVVLPKGCDLVGVELTDDAIDLPNFRHPDRAAYILGPERGSLSPEVLEKCRFTIKIPTRFCVNVGVAGAIVMYDRLVSRGRGSRPVTAGGSGIEEMPHVFGDPVIRSLKKEK